MNGRYGRAPARYGSTKVRDSFAVPLPSRFVVIERVKPEITKEAVRAYIRFKNDNVPVRSIKLMSQPDQIYKRYLIEVSIEHYNIVRREEFWAEGVKVRNFKGMGKYWICTEPTTTDEENEETED